MSYVNISQMYWFYSKIIGFCTKIDFKFLLIFILVILIPKMTILNSLANNSNYLYCCVQMICLLNWKQTALQMCLSVHLCCIMRISFQTFPMWRVMLVRPSRILCSCLVSLRFSTAVVMKTQLLMYNYRPRSNQCHSVLLWDKKHRHVRLLFIFYVIFSFCVYQKGATISTLYNSIFH